MSDATPSPALTVTDNTPPLERVVVRPYPKVIFFWLTWVVSLVAGIVSTSSDSPPEHLGTIWMCVFAFNVMVISFDFNEVLAVLMIALTAVLVFAGLYFDFLGAVGGFFRSLDVDMNDAFYFTMFGFFTIVYAIVFIRTRFEYWEFRHNEVIHRCGVFAEIKRYSTEDLRWFKEIPDVLERILCGAGRMILTTPREPHPIVIEHVLGISRIDERVADLLGVKRVTMN